MDSCPLRTGLGSCHAGLSSCAWSVPTARVTAATRNCHKGWAQGLPSSSEARGNNRTRGELTNEVKAVEVKKIQDNTGESISILGSDQFELIMGRSG